MSFKEGSTSLGTANLVNGVAKLSTTFPAAGAQSITVAYGGDAKDQPVSVVFSLTVGQASATLSFSNLSATYDGSPHAAVVTTSPAGLSGVTVSYSQNGTAVAAPTSAGSYQVSASLANSNYTATAITGTLIIHQATPTIKWASPPNIAFGTPLGAGQLDATAPVAGNFTYAPAAGKVLAPGKGQVLSVTFSPTDSTDYTTGTRSTTLTVLPPPLHIVSITPAGGSFSALPGGEIVVTFNEPLAGLNPDDPTGGGFTHNPSAVFLSPRGPSGAFLAPSGLNIGSTHINATLVYHVNADGSSTITLIPHAPLATDVYLITVAGTLTSTQGASVTSATGLTGPEYSTFTIKPSTRNNTPLKIVSVTTLHASVSIANGAVIPQPDTIAIGFNKPVDFLTTTTSTVQLLAGPSNTPVSAAVAYSPTTRTVYLTPESTLAPGKTYTIRVDKSVTDDQNFPNPDTSLTLGSVFTTRFSVRTAGVGAGKGPLVALTTNGHLQASPGYGPARTSPFGYASIPFSETVNLSSLGRYSAMLVPQQGGLNNNAFDAANTPLNAQVAFNPNLNELILVPTVLLGNDIYLYELSNMKAVNGDPLVNPGGSLPIFDTFKLSVPTAQAAVLPSAAVISEIGTATTTGTTTAAATVQQSSRSLASAESGPSARSALPMLASSRATLATTRPRVIPQSGYRPLVSWLAALDELAAESKQPSM